MAQISYYESLNAQPVALDDADIFSEFVKSPRLKDTTEAYRANPSGALKRRFPGVTWSGAFSDARRAKNLKTHSGLICLDFDHLEDLNSAFTTIASDPFTRYAFVSPSGDGIKVVCEALPLPTTPREHKRAYARANAYFGSLINSEGDATNDVTRLCFLCHDSTAHSNAASPPIVWGPTAKATQLIEQLDFIDSDPYDTWILVGQALHADADLNPALAFALWEGWSRRSPSFQEGACAAKWPTFDSDHESGVGPGTIAYLARENGWRPNREASLEYIPDGRTLFDLLPQLGIEIRQNVRDLSIQLRRLNEHAWNAELFPYDDPDAVGEDAWRTISAPVSARLRGDIASEFSVENGDELVYSDSGFWDAINYVISRNQVDPFLEWLNRLPEWDGTERLAVLIPMYFDVSSDASDYYLSELSKRLFIGAIRRSYEPGITHDWMPVLIGPQGCGKSLFVRSLLPQQRGWFSDSPSLDMPAKEQLETIGSAVLVEYPEISAVRASLVEQVKAHLSRNEDQVRKAYARESQVVLRRWVAIGTANDVGVGILPNDPSGSRRFASIKLLGPILKPAFMAECLAGDRAQLWAEALSLYHDGYPNILSPRLISEAAEANHLFESADDHLYMLISRLHSEGKIEGSTVVEIAIEAGLFNPSFEVRMSRSDQMQIARELRAFGYQKKQTRNSDGVRATRWFADSRA